MFGLTYADCLIFYVRLLLFDFFFFFFFFSGGQDVVRGVKFNYIGLNSKNRLTIKKIFEKLTGSMAPL